jgi:ribonuclease HI
MLREAAPEIDWAPGHTGIAGNEEADIIAKASNLIPQEPDYS